MSKVVAMVGDNAIRVDAQEKVTGEARYTSDEGVRLPGLLHGKILHSPYPHAKLIRIDTSRAQKLPGVRTILTGKDVPPIRIGSCVADRHLLTQEKVRFIGDAVAAVAADSIEAAEDALELVKAEYEELPGVFDPEEAMRADCTVVLHPNLPSYERLLYPYLGQGLLGPNVHTHHKVRKGCVDEGFRSADLIVENRFSTAKMVHCQLEPYNAFASVEADGTINIWSSAHQLFSVTQAMICKVFCLPPSKVRVRAQYIGGNFGASPQAERFAALLALKTGRAVKVHYTREECFLDGLNRSSTVVYIRDGVKDDGTLIAREMKVVFNGGAYANYVPLIVRNSSFALSTYRVPNLKWDAYGVYTNEPASGPLRGFGTPEVLWAVEQQMDIIAEKLGMNAVDLRKKNIIMEGEENVRGEITHSVAVQECLDKVAEWIEWGKSSEETSGSIRKGKGLAISNKYSMDSAPSGASVSFLHDGTIEVRHGAEEVGTGVNTILMQIVVEEFKVSVEKVKLVWGDTSKTPYDFGAVSSRQTFHTGNAVRLACEDLKRQIFEIAASKLGVNPQELETRGGQICFKESEEPAMAITELFAPEGNGPFAHEKEVVGKAMFVKPGSGEDPETGQGKTLVSFYTYGAQAAEVAVDTETGLVKLLRFGSAFDMGRPINPKLCEGQMEGGAVMGIGSALYEEMVMDKGRMLNPNFTDYRLPCASDIPTRCLKSMVAAAPQKDGPFGAKGIGEGTMAPTAPAIANAVYNAAGIRIRDLPITPERVLSALKELKTKERKRRSRKLR